jgi:hypothetical protein
VNGRGITHSRSWWTAAVFAVSAPLVVTLVRVLWRTPYPISETVALLEDVDTSPASFFLDPARKSWYRPLYHLTWMALWRGTGSLDTALVLFKGIEVAAVGGLIALLIWHLRPRTPVAAAAAAFAVAVLVGTPGFRDNLELPLIYTTVGMPLLLIVWMLVERERRWWYTPLILALTILAIGYKEQGLVIVPVVLVAWWMGAPGTSRTMAAAMVAMTAVYLAIRLSTSASWPAFVQDVGYGFTVLSPDQATTRFGNFPVGMYAYNMVVTTTNILFSEPTSGVFTVVRDLRSGEVAAWEINHVMSSALLTALIVWWGIGVLRANPKPQIPSPTSKRVGIWGLGFGTWDLSRRTPWSVESRVFVATVIAVAASAALGFNYTRDRLGGMAAVFYALAAYYTVRTAAERLVDAPRRLVISMGVGLVLLAGAWQLRTIGTVEHARLTAFKDRREWITNLQRRRVEFAKRAPYLRILNAMIDQGTTPSVPRPTAMPEWTGSVIGGD